MKKNYNSCKTYPLNGYYMQQVAVRCQSKNVTWNCSKACRYTLGQLSLSRKSVCGCAVCLVCDFNSYEFILSYFIIYIVILFSSFSVYIILFYLHCTVQFVQCLYYPICIYIVPFSSFSVYIILFASTLYCSVRSVFILSYLYVQCTVQFVQCLYYLI